MDGLTLLHRGYVRGVLKDIVNGNEAGRLAEVLGWTTV